MASRKSQPRTSKAKKSPRIYRKYPLTTRKKLISMVEQDGLSVYKAATELDIRQTSARLIMKTWQEEGRVFEKKTDRRKREEREREREARRKEKERRRRRARRPEPSIKIEALESPAPDQTQLALPSSARSPQTFDYVLYDNVVTPFGFIIPIYVHMLPSQKND